MGQINEKSRAERVAEVRRLLVGAPSLDEICAARNVLGRLLATEWLQRDQRKVLVVEGAMRVLSDAGWAEEDA